MRLKRVDLIHFFVLITLFVSKLDQNRCNLEEVGKKRQVKL